MGTFSFTDVTAGQVVTASVFNDLIAEIEKLNTISAANFTGAGASVPNANLVAGKSLFVLSIHAASVATGAVMSNHGTPLQAKKRVIYGDAELVGISYSVNSVCTGVTTAGARLVVSTVGSSVPVAASIRFGSNADPFFSTVQTSFLKTTFSSTARIDLLCKATGGCIRGVNVDLYFKVPHKS